MDLEIKIGKSGREKFQGEAMPALHIPKIIG